MDPTQVAVMTKQFLRLLNEVDFADRKERAGEQMIEHCKRLSSVMANNSPCPVSLDTAQLMRVTALAAENGATYSEISAVAEYISKGLQRDFEPLVLKGIVDDFLGQFKSGNDNGPDAA